MSAHCYSKRLPTTRQQQQEQHSLPSWGQDSHQGSQQGPRKPNRVPRNPGNIGCTSETSSMGTEPDSAVKWLSDMAFKSRSSPPPLDYLDVCDSSCQSSADASQISADENSAASTWYAELNGSAQSDSNEDSLSHLQLADVHDNDGECFGAGGFECVDVALESREEAGRGMGPKTVPKRQIHLRRCSTEEPLATVTPPQCLGHPKAVLCRQYSTPATIQGGSYGDSPESSPGNRKQRLQKSLSLDETSSKTKMASSLIKNVLSKKMQFELKIQQQPPEEGGQSQSSPKSRGGNLHSGLRWGHSWSQEGLPGQAELNAQGGSVQQHGSTSAKTHQKLLNEHSFNALEGAGGRPAEPHSSSVGSSKSQLSWRENTGEQEEQPADGRTGERERCFGDSAKAGAGSVASTCARAAGWAEGKIQASPRKGNQLSAVSCFPPEPPEIALASCAQEEKRESCNCLPKNVEIGVVAEAFRPLADIVLEAKETFGGAGEPGNREGSVRGQTFAPLHRVRDMRKLVKSTYSSPFNFNGASGERHPGKKMLVLPRLSAQTQPDRAGEMGCVCIISNYRTMMGGAPLMSRDEKITVRSVSELVTQEVRVPNSAQKLLPSTKKPTVTTGYNQQLTEVMTTPSYLSKSRTPPTSSYKEQPQKLRGATVLAAHEQTPALPICPTPLLQARPKETVYPLPGQDRDGHGTLLNCPPDPSELTRGASDRGRSRSPHRPPLEAQPVYPCSPKVLPAMFNPELGGQAAGAGKAAYLPGGGSLVFGQNPRRLLLDPETGTCFYVEMPSQPRRKVLFDPESGQYMEVLVPPQALYPPSINPCLYPYRPSPGVYPPQYLPYSMLSLPQGPSQPFA